MSKLTNQEIHTNYLNLIKETEKTLKKCPFCGGSVKMFETDEGMGYDSSLVVRIQCQSRGCGECRDGGLFSPRWTEEPYEKLMAKNCKVVLETAKKWNRRAE